MTKVILITELFSLPGFDIKLYDNKYNNCGKRRERKDGRFRRNFKRGATVIYTSHYMEEAILENLARNSKPTFYL